jgi:hypothetical protein
MSRALVIQGDIVMVPLTRGCHAVIDAADIPLVEGSNWSAIVSKRRKAVYAGRVKQVAGQQKMILLHRHLMSAPDGMQVDHKDGDGLNCRRENMRLCTHADNQINKGVRVGTRSGLKGVSWEERAGRWKSEITLRGKKKWLGYFDTPDAAHAAYVRAAIDLHGEFARLK